MNARDRSADPLRHERRAMQEALSRVASRIRTAHRQTEQLSTLREEERHASERIARLEPVLDIDRVAAHVRRVVAHAELVDGPVPYLVASNVLPSDVYQAVLEAIPARVFFEGGAERGQQLRVPPRLAPSYAIVTWMFLTDVVLGVLSDLLIDRFAEPLAFYARERFGSLPAFRERRGEIALSERRIVRRTRGYAGVASPDRPWDFLTGVVYLGRPEDTEEYGSRLQGATIPFRANSALACVAAAETHTYASIPSDAPEEVERYTYEFGIGLTRDAQRTLAALMRK